MILNVFHLLTEYLSKKLVEKTSIQVRVVCSYRSETITNKKKDMSFLESSHEEADTKMLFHAIQASGKVTSKIRIFSPDTDVLVLAIRRFPLLANDSAFVQTGSKIREFPLQAIYNKLGPLKAAALPGLHALSGADVTGSFRGKSKTTFWKKFLVASTHTLETLASLGETEEIEESVYSKIDQFICSLYNQNQESLSGLRWWTFSKKQSSDALPPILGALRPDIKRCHYQCMEWCRDILAHTNLPSPDDYGWKFENGKYEPITSDLSLAPDFVLNNIKCSCQKSRYNLRCKCASSGLFCTEMWECSGNTASCDNVTVND